MEIYFSLGLHEGRPYFRRSLHPSKANIQQLKHEISSLFLFLWAIFGPHGSGSNLSNQCGSGYTTLRVIVLGITNLREGFEWGTFVLLFGRITGPPKNINKFK
jgi:hypothetical protein